MDAGSARSLVEDHLDRMSDTTVNDEASAHQALALALSAVGGINQGLAPLSQDELTSARLSDTVIEKLEDWIKRLVDKLTEIVKQLAKGTSFSISVGTGVSVTVNFAPIS